MPHLQHAPCRNPPGGAAPAFFNGLLDSTEYPQKDTRDAPPPCNGNDRDSGDEAHVARNSFFDLIVQEHRNMVFTFSYALLRDADIAEKSPRTKEQNNHV